MHSGSSCLPIWRRRVFSLEAAQSSPGRFFHVPNKMPILPLFATRARCKIGEVFNVKLSNEPGATRRPNERAAQSWLSLPGTEWFYHCLLADIKVGRPTSKHGVAIGVRSHTPSDKLSAKLEKIKHCRNRINATKQQYKTCQCQFFMNHRSYSQ